MNQSREVSRIVQTQERFEQALRGAYDDPWWRQFVGAVRDRRQEFMEQLVAGTFEQRMEDRIRGQIAELTWILALDRYGETHQTLKESTNGRTTG